MGGRPPICPLHPAHRAPPLPLRGPQADSATRRLGVVPFSLSDSQLGHVGRVGDEALNAGLVAPRESPPTHTGGPQIPAAPRRGPAFRTQPRAIPCRGARGHPGCGANSSTARRPSRSRRPSGRSWQGARAVAYGGHRSARPLCPARGGLGAEGGGPPFASVPGHVGGGPVGPRPGPIEGVRGEGSRCE